VSLVVLVLFFNGQGAPVGWDRVVLWAGESFCRQRELFVPLFENAIALL
jgi:hypothetical protein